METLKGIAIEYPRGVRRDGENRAMLKMIEVVFDGKAFVPTGPVDVPVGTRCAIQIPSLQPPPPVSAEHERLWDEITRQIEASTPPYATADEAMEALRGRL